MPPVGCPVLALSFESSLFHILISTKYLNGSVCHVEEICDHGEFLSKHL